MLVNHVAIEGDVLADKDVRWNSKCTASRMFISAKHSHVRYNKVNNAPLQLPFENMQWKTIPLVKI